MAPTGLLGTMGFIRRVQALTNVDIGRDAFVSCSLWLLLAFISPLSLLGAREMASL